MDSLPPALWGIVQSYISDIDIYDEDSNATYLNNGEPIPKDVKERAIKIVCNRVWNMPEGFRIDNIMEIISPVKCPENTSYMFSGSQFNGDISHWDTSRVTNMESMFADSQFNGDISRWNTSRVVSMYYMFFNSQFNEDISSWDISRVTTMRCMFADSQFNGDISNWNTSNVANMNSMFSGSQFNGDISNWNTSRVTDMYDMFRDSPLAGTPPLTAPAES